MLWKGLFHFNGGLDVFGFQTIDLIPFMYCCSVSHCSHLELGHHNTWLQYILQWQMDGLYDIQQKPTEHECENSKEKVPRTCFKCGNKSLIQSQEHHVRHNIYPTFKPLIWLINKGIALNVVFHSCKAGYRLQIVETQQVKRQNKVCGHLALLSDHQVFPALFEYSV